MLRQSINILNFNQSKLLKVIINDELSLKVCKKLGIRTEELIKKTREDVYLLFKKELTGDELDYAWEH